MFFKKWREKRRKEEEERFESILEKHKICSYEIENLRKDVSELSSAVYKLERICAHYIPGQITGMAGFNTNLNIWPGTYCDLLVYKNGKEYRIKGLDVEDPYFTQGDVDSTVYVESKATHQKYAVDLLNCTFVKVSDGSAAACEASTTVDHKTLCEKHRKND